MTGLGNRGFLLEIVTALAPNEIEQKESSENRLKIITQRHRHKLNCLLFSGFVYDSW
jgi:hypothetical protein